MNKFKEIKEYSSARMYNYGIFMLSRREYGRAELKEKMFRHSSDQLMINEVLDKLEKENYLSNSRAINFIINQYKNKESIYKINQRLINKGFEKDLIAESLQIIKELDSSQIILELLKKKFKIYNINNRDKMIRFLASKGFKFNQINKTIEEFKNE